MPRVRIQTPGVTVELDANEASYAELADKALKVFQEAGGWPQIEPPAVGFAATDRRATPDHKDINNTKRGFGKVSA